MSENTTFQQQTLFAEDFLARTYQWQDAARDWLENAQDSGTNSAGWLMKLARHGLLLRTCLVYCPPTEDGILPSSFPGWSTAGMASAGGFWTLDISESPNDAVGCSLSQVLEADVPPKYFLSAMAARGILRRAVKRRKKIRPDLLRALEALAQSQT
jgi:hypothetical protein